MPELIKENPATVLVKRMFSQSGKIIREQESRDELELPRMDPEAPACVVSMDKSVTKNLGNYSSFKVSAFISVPCFLDDEEIANAQTFASEQVNEAIARVMDEEGMTALANAVRG